MKNYKYKKILEIPGVSVSKDVPFSSRSFSEGKKTIVKTTFSFDRLIKLGERSPNSTSRLIDVSCRSLKYEMDEWLTSDQAAHYLKVSKKTLLNMVSSGKIPYSKLGRSNRYSLRELQMLLFSKKRGPKNGN